eukprot:scaffold1306_cov98-Skeletonema_dohrnii-CCMP3373.AAC.1
MFLCIVIDLSGGGVLQDQCVYAVDVIVLCEMTGTLAKRREQKIWRRGGRWGSHRLEGEEDEKASAQGMLKAGCVHYLFGDTSAGYGSKCWVPMLNRLRQNPDTIAETIPDTGLPA